METVNKPIFHSVKFIDGCSNDIFSFILPLYVYSYVPIMTQLPNPLSHLNYLIVIMTTLCVKTMHTFDVIAHIPVDCKKV